MSDRDDTEPVSRGDGLALTRRSILRLALLAASAAPGPIALAPPARAQGSKLGANLVGKLEGAEVVTDPALYPKTFKEAPPLAELVKAGRSEEHTSELQSLR